MHKTYCFRNVFFIGTLMVIGLLSFAQPSFDKLEYTYNSNTNQLNYIKDAVGISVSPVDLDSQISNNYQYDANGRLISDVAQGILKIEWSSSDKIKQVSIDDSKDGIADRTLQFIYDAMGNRIKKTETYHSYHTPQVVTYYYIYNANGQLVSIYNDEGNGIKREEIEITDGSDHIALLSMVSKTEFERKVGFKNFQLNDQLGNVRIVVNDIKEPVSLKKVFKSNIQQVSDYFSYGMLMPGRDINSSNYRWGYQGKEKVDELKGSGNAYDFGARMLDPRAGRWLSPDPLEGKMPSVSTYSSNNNNPVNVIDPDGREGERIALTFDDGINVNTTPEILTILKENDIKATFFITSYDLSPEQYEIYLRMLDEGHIVASHGGKHTNKAKQPLSETRQDFRNADKLVKGTENNTPIWYLRFPYGAADQSQVDLANSEGYIVTYWDIDSWDWCYNQGRGYCTIRNEIPKEYHGRMIDHLIWQTKENGGGIILMHDIQKYTAGNLSGAIDALRDEGYIFTNLNDPAITIPAGPGFSYRSQLQNDPDLLKMREEFTTP